MTTTAKRPRLDQSGGEPSTSEREDPQSRGREGEEEGGSEGGEGEGQEEEEDEGVEEQMKNFFSELDVDFARQKRNLMTEGLRAPRRKSQLPVHLHSVMGSANLRLARGDPSGAIDLCLEVIRQAPHSPEPYLTLSTVYEELGDKEKLLQILVISAHLKKVDVELWVKAGQVATDLNNLPLAARCYHQACKLEPDNPMYLWQRALIHQNMNDAGKASSAYQQLLEMLPPTNGHDIVEVSKELAQLYYHHCNDAARAIDVLHDAVFTHMTVADAEAVHLLVELQISSKNYQNAYELLTTYYNMIPEQANDRSHDQSHDQMSSDAPTFQQMLSSAIRVSLSGDTEEMAGEGEGEGEGGREGEVGSTAPVELMFPDDLPVDMRVKLAVCLVHLSVSLPPSLLPPVLEHPEEYGDLFIDLAEAYTETGSPSQALPLLSALVHTERYNQAAVWLKHAECLHTLHDLEGAAMSYSKVLSLAPHHTDTRLALATIYVQLGGVEDALALLESQHCDIPVAMETTEESSNEAKEVTRLPEQPDYTLEGLRVLLHRYTVLVNSGRVSEYVVDGTSLLAVLFRDVYHRKDLRTLIHLSVRKLAEKLRDDLGQKSSNIAHSLLSLAEWWSLFLTTCKGLLTLGPAHHPQVLHLVLCAATLSTFDLPEMEQEFILFASSLCYMMRYYSLAFTFIKTICIKLGDQSVFWNILNALPLTSKYQKFILRLCFKAPNNLTLLRIHANYSLATSNYKFALCLYDQTYRQVPTDYLTSLCIGSVYFSMATQKWAMSRNQLVLQGMGFFSKYLKLRGVCQETMYNLGRAFHQIGIVHAACHFYRQVLALEPENTDPKWRLASDLRPEAAFNLSLIYLSSGNRPLAIQILRQYCRI